MRKINRYTVLLAGSLSLFITGCETLKPQVVEKVQRAKIEGVDGEDKLGQPMLQFSLVTGAGIFDVFYLPYHRKLQFPGKRGRFRTPIILDADEVGYESSNKEWQHGEEPCSNEH